LASDNVTINATINYTYPGVYRELKDNQSINESNSIPIIEVTRETPRTIGNNRVFESQLTVHNRGCGITTSTTVKEILSTGWTPANPGIKTNDYGTDISVSDTDTDLEANIITWELGSMAANKYAVLTYQIKSPTATDSTGDFKFNVSWDGNKDLVESRFYQVRTLNYSSESHLEFDIETIQQAEFPQPETRSAQPNVDYNYSLKTTNVGDINATGWNITLEIPSQCTVQEVFNGGAYNSTLEKIIWSLDSLDVRVTTPFNFTLNCTESNEYVLVAEAVKDNATKVSFTDSVSGVTCSDSKCSDVETLTFSKPTDPRYEKDMFSLGRQQSFLDPFTIVYNQSTFKTDETGDRQRRADRFTISPMNQPFFESALWV